MMRQWKAPIPLCHPRRRSLWPPGPLVPGSLGPLVPWSPGPPVPGPLVPFACVLHQAVKKLRCARSCFACALLNGGVQASRSGYVGGGGGGRGRQSCTVVVVVVVAAAVMVVGGSSCRCHMSTDLLAAFVVRQCHKPSIFPQDQKQTCKDRC